MNVPLNVSVIVLVLTVLATAVMSASAAIQAVRNKFDPIGAIFLSVVTAVGGGTLRDLLIGASPVFWLRDVTYLSTAVPVGLLTFLLARKMQGGNGRREKLLNYFDAIGLALFTLVGIKVSIANGIEPHFAVVMGCITGIAGGMVRDILCGLTPMVLRKDVYASLSLAGGAFYLLLGNWFSDELAVGVTFFAIAISRIIIIARNPAEPMDG
jgi:uncharacterized membrane protein YeiH